MSKADLVDELHKPARRHFLRRKIAMRGINDTLQADLAELRAYSKQNKGHNYILCVINIFSKKAYVRAIKDKRLQP